MRDSDDPCPKSAVSHGVGIAGLFGLGLWTLVARHYGMNGPNAGLAAVVACGLPMVLWSLLIDKVHRNASTGIDWHAPARPVRSVLDISIVKIAGLWATWLAIAIFYCVARAWAVKGFFLAFMVSIVPGNFSSVVEWRIADALANPIALAGFLIAVMFMIDVCLATVGYILTFKPLDSHIRTANPYLAGWLAALICYPPFVLMGGGGPLDYHAGGAEWDYWTQGSTTLQWLLGGWLVLLTAIYAWATMAFGLRFSNLTHRGILTHGPYRWTRHPAYLSKNLFWWFSALPFRSVSGSITDIVRNCAMLGLTNAVYYWRARTEEQHLSADPDYRAYSDWMERNAPVPRFFAWVTGRKREATAVAPTAEQPAS